MSFPSQFGTWVDIRQQDSSLQRMHYAGMDTSERMTIGWIGIMEETATRYSEEPKA